MLLNAGFRDLVESVAAGDGGVAEAPIETPTTPSLRRRRGVFVDAGLAGLGNGHGIEQGRPVTEEHVRGVPGIMAEPLTREPLGTVPSVVRDMDIAYVNRSSLAPKVPLPLAPELLEPALRGKFLSREFLCLRDL
jgi:hypothetical protein